jgi:adenylosuccinate synthase
MANLIVLGTQWGDEGKGKIIDLLSPSFDIIARYQGGHNAGHTVYVNGRKIVLHLIPSGILHPVKLCIIGNGVVIHPKAFLDELAELEKFGVSVDENIVVSRSAHLIFPYHLVQEKICEERSGSLKIGTTLRGIGPTYQDKASRCGIRAGDLLNLPLLKEKIERNVEVNNLWFSKIGKPLLDAKSIFDEYVEYASQMKKYIRDVSTLLNGEIKKGKAVLFEGAQGTLLDIDHGTYPYVTSSNSTAGGACTGLGVGPDKIDGVLGVTKAYTTRVGSGPFPTEIRGKEGKMLLEKGNEFGATTGRPRRCGWFDAVAVSYACRLNGIERIVLTKSDILEGLEQIKVCTGYRYRGQILQSFPTDSWVLEEVEPQYKNVKGWTEPLRKASEYAALPQAFKDYARMLEDLIGVRIAIVSTGMDRKDTLLIEEELEGLVDLNEVKAGL